MDVSISIRLAVDWLIDWEQWIEQKAVFLQKCKKVKEEIETKKMEIHFLTKNGLFNTQFCRWRSGAAVGGEGGADRPAGGQQRGGLGHVPSIAVQRHQRIRDPLHLRYCIVPRCSVTLAPPPYKQIVPYESNKPIKPKLTYRQSINQPKDLQWKSRLDWLI